MAIKTEIINGTTNDTTKWLFRLVVTVNSFDSSSQNYSITLRSELTRASGSFPFSGNATCRLNCNGENRSEYLYCNSGGNVPAGTWKELWSQTFTLHHAGSSSISVPVSASMNSSEFNPSSGSASGSISLEGHASKPTVSALQSEEITSNSLRLSFSITNTGGASITSKGINIYSDFRLSKLIKSSNTEEILATNLTRHKTYYARGYATNSAGTTYTKTKAFTTLPERPTLSGLTVLDKTDDSISLSFSILDNGGKGISSSKIEISETNFGEIIKSINSNSGTITGLQPNKTYYARGYATNGETYNHTDILEFILTSGEFVQVSINGGDYEKHKLLVSINGGEYITIDKTKFNILK